MKYRERHVGFTLLEVILALAILGIAMATLGSAVGHAHRNSRQSTKQTELAMVASSVLEEVLAGSRDLTAVTDEVVVDPSDPTAPPIAKVSIVIGNSPYEDLFEIRVRAQSPDNTENAVRVELVRWMLDPSLIESTSSTAEDSL